MLLNNKTENKFKQLNNIKRNRIHFEVIVSSLFVVFFIMLCVALIIYSYKNEESYSKTIKFILNSCIIFSIIVIPLIWLILINITILGVQYQYQKNIFKGIKWLKCYYFIKFQYSNITDLKVNKNVFKTDLVKFIKFMNSNNLVLQGSCSIAYKYKDYYREFNDIDFLGNSNKRLDTEKLKFENFTFESNNLNLGKGKYTNHPIEVLNVKTITKKSYCNYNDVNIPNYYWMLAMKYSQFFKILQVNKDFNNDLIIKKMNNTLADIAFLLSKKRVFSFKKFYENFELLILSNSFFEMLINQSKLFNLYDEDTILKLNNFLKDYQWKQKNMHEVFLWLELITKKLTSSQKFLQFNKSINRISGSWDKSVLSLVDKKIVLDYSDIKNLNVKINYDNYFNYYKNELTEMKKNNLSNLFVLFKIEAKEKEVKVDIRNIIILQILKESYED
ncbi:MAG4530 family protein [Mycoplasma crocodyli]|uniref:Uncharacterized protein n=1 Tax=Mycoplasma crocodyli (strain ATCC 51981 / MP145) TaxID=512564 RepID=D5E5R3_MYCCM|nr:hypothetical protein [Mycoplasma crocodyli]ADE19443.1 hypothetical protein MCRO_0481 [Mycoplasma crocodyli MP145]